MRMAPPLWWHSANKEELIISIALSVASCGSDDLNNVAKISVIQLITSILISKSKQASSSVSTVNLVQCKNLIGWPKMCSTRTCKNMCTISSLSYLWHPIISYLNFLAIAYLRQWRTNGIITHDHDPWANWLLVAWHISQLVLVP